MKKIILLILASTLYVPNNATASAPTGSHVANESRSVAIRLRKTSSQEKSKYNRAPSKEEIICYYYNNQLNIELPQTNPTAICSIHIFNDNSNLNISTTAFELSQGVEIGTFQHFDIEIEIENYGVFTGSL